VRGEGGGGLRGSDAVAAWEGRGGGGYRLNTWSELAVWPPLVSGCKRIFAQ